MTSPPNSLRLCDNLRSVTSPPNSLRLCDPLRSGFAAAVVILVLGVSAALGWAAIKLPSLFAPAKPDTVGLSSDQQKLADAQAAAAQATAQLQLAQDAATTARDSQLRNAQQMNAGVGLALASLPPTPPSILAVNLNTRAQTALAAAIGHLPPEQQAAIATIVDESLSGQATQIAAAQAQLAATTADLATATAARSAAETKAAQLASTVQSTAAAQSAAEVALTAKTNEVAATATALADEQAKGSLLSNEIKSLLGYLLLIGAVYFFVHYLLPILAQTFPAFAGLTRLYNFITALVSAHAVIVPAAPVSPVPPVPGSK